MTTLNKAKQNQVYKVIGFEGKDKTLRRFLELGFSVGQKVRIISTSLQKKVFLVELRGYLLSVRAQHLSCIVVEKVGV